MYMGVESYTGGNPDSENTSKKNDSLPAAINCQDSAEQMFSKFYVIEKLSRYPNFTYFLSSSVIPWHCIEF